MRRLLIILALALFLVACEAGEKKVDISANPFIGGSQGLSIGFQDFRSEVFDGGQDPFDVLVKLENKGESFVDKDNVKVKLSGVNPIEFGKSEAGLLLSPSDDVVETRKDPQGGVLPAPQVFVEFADLNHASPISGSVAQFPLRAEVCYLYRTRAVSKLCVRSNLLTPKAGGICEINENKVVYNSGAPVQVSNFKESTRAKDKLGFTFEVSNVGSGNVFQRNSLCDRSERRNENRVYVIVATGLSGLDCTGLESTATGAEGFVNLFGGSKIVSCAQSVASSSDYEQLTNIEVIYDYEEMTQTSLVVKSSGE